MPRETFLGPDVSSVLAQAQNVFGADALVLSLRRTGSGGPFELVAADTAASVERRRVAVASPGIDDSSVPAPIDAERARLRQGPAVIALVGPTGAGKTTTIAKLANHPAVFGARAVGLLCLDTYRVGAVEQLRIYAELSRLPLEVVYEPRELEAAQRRLSGVEVILVDTAGRGPSAHRDTAASRELLLRLRPFETHLTIPTGLQMSHARRIVAHARGFGITHLIATKVDEAPDDPSVFELAAEFRLPMRWLTDGQEVPGDLKAAGPARLAAASFRTAAVAAERVGAA